MPARADATRETELQAQIDAAYRATHLVTSARSVRWRRRTRAAALFAPDNQRTWHVENGRLVPDGR